MIITRTPVRISFFGGGTDYSAYYLRHGGATLTTAVDKYVYVTVQHLTEFFEHNIQVHYSRVESVGALDEIQIPNVRETLRLLGIAHGVEIHLVGDLPARSGLGSSSATTVGLLKALHGYLGRLIDDHEAARQAVHVERHLCGERVGSQDQYICAHGGFRHLQFLPDGEVRVEPVPLDQERLDELQASLMLMYTGQQRAAHEVLTEQVQRTQEGELDDRLAQMKAQVTEAIRILGSADPIGRFGELLHEAWELKRSLSSRISNPWLDEVYGAARAAGAIGGKLLGAGAGGFLLLLAEPAHQPAVEAALYGLKRVPFRFESSGSSIIFYQPDDHRRRRGEVTDAGD